MIRRLFPPGPVLAVAVIAAPVLAAVPRLLSRIGGSTLGYPVAADTTGQLADGYGVRDLPWVEVTTGGGQIRVKHHGWLTATTLARLAR